MVRITVKIYCNSCRGLGTIPEMSYPDGHIIDTVCPECDGKKYVESEVDAWMTEEKKAICYKMSVNCDNISVEAPTKQECIDLFNEAKKVGKKYPINEAIR